MMNIITKSRFVSLLFLVPTLSVAVGKTDTLVLVKTIELPKMVVTASPGDIDIFIARERGVRGRYGSINGILVEKVRPGSVYDKCGIKPGFELVSIQGIVFAGTDLTKKQVIAELEKTEVTKPYFEFQVCPRVTFKVIRRGKWESVRLVRQSPVETIRVPMPPQIGTEVATK